MHGGPHSAEQGHLLKVPLFSSVSSILNLRNDVSGEVSKAVRWGEQGRLLLLLLHLHLQN